MKFNIENLDALELELDLESVIPEAMDAAMPELVNATKNSIRSVIRHPDESTGDLIASVKATKAKPSKGGGYYAGVVFSGTGRNGTRNGLKAAELEYGNSCQPPTPFADRAVHSAERKIVDTVEDYLAKEMNK